jgi:3-oxoacyl-[acyl-carrier-protein] synthase II
MLAGGTDSLITPLAIATLARIGALTKSHNADPATASRPFDRGRDGFVLGEGAGILTLETLSHAQARGARIYAEVLGIGGSFDATDDTAPDVEGQYLAMRRALEDAGVEAEEIDGVKAHGTSTVLNDKTETVALKRLLGNRAYQVPITAPKSKIGHAAAAAGAIEAVAAIGMLVHQAMAPTANLTQADPECDLDYVPGKARFMPLQTMLLNAFGLGGQNWSLVLRKG